MAWLLTGDAGQFLSAAGDYLRSRPAHHTILLSSSDSVRGRGTATLGWQAPLFGWWTGSGQEVDGAFVHMPPLAVVLSQLTGDAAAALPEALAGTGDFPPGVNGPAGSAAAFADAWQARTGCGVTVQRRTRLWRLDELRPPGPFPPGAARTARRRDRNLLIDWVSAFGRETDDVMTDPEPMIDERLGYGGLTLWESAGQPVSLAGVTRLVAGHVRIAPLYTPPQFRGCGFAAAVTTAVTRAALAAGATGVVLFTDLSNPTSNDLCQRLGYQPLADHAELAFSPAGPGGQAGAAGQAGPAGPYRR